eukprot:364837-Chlamydomonas_euryale.AAC.19
MQALPGRAKPGLKHGQLTAWPPRGQSGGAAGIGTCERRWRSSNRAGPAGIMCCRRRCTVVKEPALLGYISVPPSTPSTSLPKPQYPASPTCRAPPGLPGHLL